MYESGGCLLDLCLQTGRRGVSLVRQVLRASNPAEAYGGARVVLCGAWVLTEVTSDEFGELLMEAEDCAVPWMLGVEVGGHTMVVRLPNSVEC